MYTRGVPYIVAPHVLTPVRTGMQRAHSCHSMTLTARCKTLGRTFDSFDLETLFTGGRGAEPNGANPDVA